MVFSASIAKHSVRKSIVIRSFLFELVILDIGGVTNICYYFGPAGKWFKR